RRATPRSRLIVLLHAADIARRLGRRGSARRLLASALRAPLRFVFPSRHETRAAIERLLRPGVIDAASRGLRWKLDYLLGVLHAWRGRIDAARAALARAASARPRFATLYAVQAKIARRQKDHARAAALLRRAIAGDSADFRLYVALDHSLDVLGRHGAREVLLARAPRAVRANPSVRLRRALLATQRGRHDEALAILGAHSFPPWEGWTGARDVYLLALFGKAEALAASKRYDAALAAMKKALLWPENLGTGRPQQPDEANVHFAIGELERALGRRDAARASWRRAAQAHELTSPHVAFRAAALRRLGRAAEAKTLLGKARAALAAQLWRVDPWTHERYYGYALVLRELRDNAGARAALAKALARRPDYAWARRLQARLSQSRK
ncbi:MAG: hypothetical protein KC503_22475, partial [Myxococcales bacterium]|nr:hypothetical protein [Myxococcales bacterium]